MESRFCGHGRQDPDRFHTGGFPQPVRTTASGRAVALFVPEFFKRVNAPETIGTLLERLYLAAPGGYKSPLWGRFAAMLGHAENIRMLNWNNFTQSKNKMASLRTRSSRARGFSLLFPRRCFYKLGLFFVGVFTTSAP